MMCRGLWWTMCCRTRLTGLPKTTCSILWGRSPAQTLMVSQWQSRPCTSRYMSLRFKRPARHPVSVRWSGQCRQHRRVTLPLLQLYAMRCQPQQTGYVMGPAHYWQPLPACTSRHQLWPCLHCLQMRDHFHALQCCRTYRPTWRTCLLASHPSASTRTMGMCQRKWISSPMRSDRRWALGRCRSSGQQSSGGKGRPQLGLTAVAEPCLKPKGLGWAATAGRARSPPALTLACVTSRRRCRSSRPSRERSTRWLTNSQKILTRPSPARRFSGWMWLIRTTKTCAGR
mmetsp:Transcript_37606/g.107431  ORF Transcript_37606/g.107431 Transcript_37606/m.107431 type:complete len:285 (+) Transcript_37606:279-1133(+)